MKAAFSAASPSCCFCSIVGAVNGQPQVVVPENKSEFGSELTFHSRNPLQHDANGRARAKPHGRREPTRRGQLPAHQTRPT
jgi:hypothetical protein